MRFAQAFGYSGFSDLQDVFKAYLAGGGRRARDHAHSPWDGASSGDAARLVDGFIGASATSLAHVRQRLDLAQFEIMSQTLASADLIHIIGSKRAFSLVSYVSLALANLGVRNLALDNVGSTAFELLRCASASDAVLAVSFTPYNSITPELAASAAQRGVPIVSLTDSAFSPLVPVSKAYIEVIEESFSGFKSLSATLAVAMALVLRVEQRRGEAASRGQDSGAGGAPIPVRRRFEWETIEKRKEPAAFGRTRDAEMADRRRQFRTHAHGRPPARGRRASQRRDRRECATRTKPGWATR